MSSNREIMARDLNVLWHPCTQMKDHEHLPLIPIRRGDGVWLEDFDGNRYIDAISSWWVNILGHGNPRINRAVHEQLDKLEHVILAGFSHEPVVALSERLVALTPPGLDRVFFADNGSSGIEVALKMSFHYWQNKGRPQKQRFVTLGNSYHGETLAALAVGDVALYKSTYKPLLMDVFTAPSPDCYHREEGESWEAYSSRQFAGMKKILAEHHEEISGVIVEPLVQCAGGMRMYHPIYLKLLRDACDKYDVHLIADEIAVGFGRTGTLFACEQAGITPDFLTLSKALTGGYLPLCAVLTSNEVYNAFYDDYSTLRAFLHSHSFTGNPLACAAALATLDIFETDNLIERNHELASHMARALARFNDHPHVSEVRQTGMIAAVEMVRDKRTREPYDWKERRGMRVYEHALSRQALLRPLGNVTYFMPPYIITPEQIDHLAEVAWEGITSPPGTDLFPTQTHAGHFMRRFFDPQPFTQGLQTALGDEASHHIARVLRMQPGDRLHVFNGHGGAWDAEIISVSKKAVTVLPQAFEAENRTAPSPVTVALPMIKGERMDYALQKATELGAARFQLLNTERTDVRIDGDRQDKKLRHWQQVVISACEQCGMNMVPVVHAPVPLLAWLAHAEASLKLIAHPGEAPLTDAALHAATDIALLTGPEGGFSGAELQAAAEHGFVAFALGNRVLRAETAPVALLAALWARLPAR